MKRRNLCALVLAGVSTWFAPAVHAEDPGAQAFSQGVTLKTDGKSVANATKVFVNRKDCEEPATYEFGVTLTGPGAVQGTQVPVLEVWGTNGGVDCSDPNNRKSGSNGTKSYCYLVWRSSGSEAIRVGQSNNVTVTADDLFQNSGNRDGMCDLNAPAPSTIDIFFLPLSAATPNGTGEAPAPIASASVDKATFTLFTAQPASPTGISGKGGQDELSVDWNAANVAGTTVTYKVYFDWGAEEEDTTSCGSGALVEGHDAPATGNTLTSVLVSDTSASLTNLDAKAIAINDSVAAAVVTVDVAGNESPLSKVVCIQRTKEVGKKKSSSSCSAAPGRPAGAPLAALTTAGLALVCWRRRKNRA